MVKSFLQKVGSAEVFMNKNHRIMHIYIYTSQIIATSHDLTSNGGLVRESPLFQENLGW